MPQKQQQISLYKSDLLPAHWEQQWSHGTVNRKIKLSSINNNFKLCICKILYLCAFQSVIFFLPYICSTSFWIERWSITRSIITAASSPFQATILRNDLTLPLSRTGYIGALLNIMEKRRIFTRPAFLRGMRHKQSHLQKLEGWLYTIRAST